MSPQIGVADAPLFVNPGGAEERDRLGFAARPTSPSPASASPQSTRLST
jgi:hypothetical protein